MRVKQGLISIFILAAFLAGEVHASSGRIGIAAVVNDDIVTFSDLDMRLKLYTSGSEQAIPEAQQKKLEMQVLNRLIDERLQMQEAESMGIVINDEQITGGLTNIAQQNGVSVDEFKAKLLGNGIQLATLKDQIKAEIAWSQVVRRRLRPQVSISETDIDTELTGVEQGKKEFLLAEIFLPVNNGAQENVVKEQIENVSGRILGGEKFAQMARQFSQSPGAANGGDLGWVREGQLEGVLEQTVKSLQPGQMSPPVRAEKGYYLLLLRQQRVQGETGTKNATSSPADREIVHLKQIMLPVGIDDPAPVVAAKTVRAEALKEEVKTCEDMDKISSEFQSEGTGDLGKGPVSALAEPLQKAIEGLDIGKLSAPIRTANGLAVVMVCEREETPITAAEPSSPEALLDDDASREEIANKLGLQRLQQMQDHYLRDLRAAAYIDRRI